MSDQCTQHSGVLLLNEIWLRSFSYLEQNDLFILGNVSQNFLSMSSDDSLWEPHCHRRWKGKQNVKRFARREERGEENNGRLGRYCSTLIRQYHQSRVASYRNDVPALNMGSLSYEPSSWKEAYILAEIDSRRPVMTREELIHFKWQLIYDGSPSRMGLRKFNENGTYWSPYMGMCEWLLHGQHLMFAGMSLLVEKNMDNWGWVIGRDQRTVYHSVEEDNSVGQQPQGTI